MRYFVKAVGSIFAGLMSIALIGAILAGSLGAFGWPTQDPIWMLLTVPVGLALVSCIVAAWLIFG